MATVEPIVREPQVIAAVSERAGEEIVVALDLQRRAADALPDRARFLSAPLATAAANLIQERLESFLGRERVQSVLVAAIRFAHERLVAFLQGESRLVLLSDGQVTLNLFPLIGAGLRLIEDTGLIPSSVTLPDVQNATPEQGRKELSQALGVELPATFGEVVVADSRQLEDARAFVRLFDAFVVALPLLTVVLICAAVVLSQNRRRTVIQLAIGVALSLILGYLLIQLLGASVVTALREQPAGRAAVGAAVDQLVSSLTTIIVVLAGVCLVVGVGAYFVEGSRRTAAQTQTGSLAGRLPSGEAAMAWIGDHADYLRLAGLGAALILLIGIDLTWSAFVFIIALQIAYQAGLSVVGRGRRRSEPEI